MLSKVMELETDMNESFAKEKKRKKDETPKSSKKRKINESPKKPATNNLNEEEIKAQLLKQVMNETLNENQDETPKSKKKRKKTNNDSEIQQDTTSENNHNTSTSDEDTSNDTTSGEDAKIQSPSSKRIKQCNNNEEKTQSPKLNQNNIDEVEEEAEKPKEPVEEQNKEEVVKEQEKVEPEGHNGEQELIEKRNKEMLEKLALFDAKKFRQLILNKQTCYGALKDFVDLCTLENTNRDITLEYLESGGNTSEIIRVIEIAETKTASFALPIVEVLTIVLVKIISSHPQKQLQAEESSREFLNKHYSVIKSMLALNSSSKQRKSALKMLSAMVSLSTATAKEVLSHANFDQAILEILYQPSNLEDGSSVRTHFTHFLISFLVDGNAAVIIPFLEKRNLLTSIFPGLIYDTVKIVTLVLSTIQTHVLEDKAVSKTIKMNLFNTQTIQTIVNLYNWTGPQGWNPKKRRVNQITVDPEQKLQVTEIVQKFLTCLCASKHGIIFFDPTVGLSQKRYNPLLITVLSSLSKPWTNEHKKELLFRICIACPDMVRPVMIAVDGFLEPRVSNNWLNVVHFVNELITVLSPTALEPFLPKLQSRQLALVMQQVCIPQIILAKIKDGLAMEYLQIKYECVDLLNTMLDSTKNYINFVQETRKKDTVVKGITTGYLTRCLPSSSVLLNNWYQNIQNYEKEANFDEKLLNAYLTKLLDVLYQYYTFCPALVENITKDIDVKQFLTTIDRLSEKQPDSYDLHIKSINLLISCDITLFAPSKELFAYAVPLLLKFYHNTEGSTQLLIESMLYKLFKVTSIFDCCVDEIMVWLYSILDQPKYDDKLAQLLTKILIQTHNDFKKYSNEMTQLKEQFIEGNVYRDIIKNLSNETESSLKLHIQNKHRTLSPFLLGVLDVVTNEPKEKVYLYLTVALMNLLHYQTNPTLLVNIITDRKYLRVIKPYLYNYTLSFKLHTNVEINENETPENTVYFNLIEYLTNQTISELPALIEYCNEHSKYFTKTIMTNLVMFYYTHKCTTDTLSQTFQTKCYEFLLYIINTSDEKNLNNCLKAILEHPIILDMFSPTFTKNESSKLSTEFLINIIKKLQNMELKLELVNYLQTYQLKLVEEIHKLFEDYNKTIIKFAPEQFMETVKLFGLSYDNCSKILNILLKIPISSFEKDEVKTSILFKLQSYIMGFESNSTNFTPFSNEILTQINAQMIVFNATQLNLEELELNLCSYIKQFPHTNINFNSELFETLITKANITKSTIRLASILLQTNHQHLEIFLKHLPNIYDKRELVFSLVNSVMNHKTDPVKTLLGNVYKEYEQVLMKYLNKPQKAANYLVENYQVIIKLINEQLITESCKEFCGKSHKFDSTEIQHFEALTTIFNKTILVEASEDISQKYIINYLTTSMNLLTNILKRPNKTDEDWNKIEKVGKHFCTYVIKLKNVYKRKLHETKIYSGAAFQTFAKLCLKFGLQEKPILVNLLKHLCLFTPAGDNVEIKDLGVLFEMAISHSESLNILLSDDEKKAPLLSLLLALCIRCKSVMVKSHIPIWLSAYEATLSETDQYLLQLLSMYESANIGFHEFRPYLWGKAAVAHYSVRSAIETTLWRQPKPKDVLDLFNENRIVHTVQNFPLARRLQDDKIYSDSDIEVYDPAFYLPLLSHLMAPESTIRWYQGTQRGIISLPIIALTSENAEIRAAACNVLARFHSHIEAATYAKQRLLWLHLIEAVCRGTSVLATLRPCTIVAVFLARCSIIFTRPDHALYSTLGNFITAKECPSFHVVPELLTMLHNTEVNHTSHRNFILEVIRDGLCTDEDLRVLYRSVAFKLIMDLYNSVLIDLDGKILILEILGKAVTLQNGARTLVSSYNLISWFHAVIRQFSLNKRHPELFYNFVKILNNLVTSFEDELFNHLQFNLLLLLVAIIDKFQNVPIELMHLVKYIQVFYKLYDRKPQILTKTQLLRLLTMSSQLNCQICNYYLEYGDEFVESPTLTSDDAESVGLYYLKLLTLKWIQSNKN